MEKSEIRKGTYLTGDGNLSDCQGGFGKLRAAGHVTREAPARRVTAEIEADGWEAFRRRNEAEIAQLADRLLSVKTRLAAVQKARRK